MKFILKKIVSRSIDAQVLIDVEVDSEIIETLSYSMPIEKDDTQASLMDKIKTFCRQEKEKYQSQDKVKLLITFINTEIDTEEEQNGI